MHRQWVIERRPSMKHIGTPMALWMVFANSFQKQLLVVFGYDKVTAKKSEKTQR